MGFGASCNFGHIYCHNSLWQMLSHITLRIMLCLNTVTDVFATAFGRLFCMMWYILAHICNGRCYCHMLWLMLLLYISIVADVCAIDDNIGSHLILIKVGRCYCLEFVFMW